MALKSGNHMALERVATTWPACAIVIMLMQYVHSYNNSTKLKKAEPKEREEKKKKKNFLMSGLKMALQFSILPYKIMKKN
jgi:hypothetical protein